MGKYYSPFNNFIIAPKKDKLLGQGFMPYMLHEIDRSSNALIESINEPIKKKENCRNCGANWSDSGGKCVYCGTEN